MSIQLAKQLKVRLTASRQTIAVAESVTAGNIQALIASVSGSSEYFDGGVTAYNLDQKNRILGVDRNHAASVNCVSSRVAEQMAAGVRKLFRSDVCLTITGYAEPSIIHGIEIPHAYYAITTKEVSLTDRIEAPGLARIDAQRFFARAVIKRTVDVLAND